MAAIDDAATRHRAQVLAAERRASGRVLRTYATAADAIRRDLARLQARIAAAREAGDTINPDWLRQEARFHALLANAEQQMRTLVAATDRALYGASREAVRLAVAHAADTAAAVAAPGAAWTAANTAALETAVGLTAPGSPVRQVLRDMARDVPAATAQKIADRITTGVALGHNPRRTAALIARDLDGQRARALTVVRTETLRAYRTATLETYRANASLVSGWTWWSALDDRTCPACWAMHGKQFPLTEPMGGHPNCRCTMLPDVPGVDPVVPGTVEFDAASSATQRRVLGPAKYAAYQDGAITLDDLVAVRHDRTWGTTRSAASLTSLLGQEAAARYYRR